MLIRRNLYVKDVHIRSWGACFPEAEFSDPAGQCDFRSDLAHGHEQNSEGILCDRYPMEVVLRLRPSRSTLKIQEHP